MTERLPRRLCAALAIGLLSMACGKSPPQIEALDASAWSVPAADSGEACTDVAGTRVCWGGSGADCQRGVCVGARPLPGVVPSKEGVRCTGQGRARVCIDRTRTASPFACEAARCVQRHPRLPDDGEWTCADASGAALCLGGAPAAGVRAGPADPGWFCALRADSQRLCLDLDADFPDGNAAGWSCHYEHEQGVSRVCLRDTGAHQLGDACDATRPCVDGASCVSARCAPPRPRPDCWLDRECGNGACRFGSCREDPP